MKKNRLITLLELLQHFNIKEIDEILEYDEKILDILVDCGSYIDKALKFIGSKDDVEKLKEFTKIIKKGLVDENIDYEVWDIEMLRTLGESELAKKEYIEDILLCRELKEANLTSEAIKIINESKEKYNAQYASYVLCNPNAIEAGIAIEGAKIINESKEEFNAKYASDVLCNPNTIKAGIALGGAKIINESKEGFNADYASRVLHNSNAIEAGIALDGAKIINNSQSIFNAQYASCVLCNPDAIEAGITIEGDKIINESKEKYNALYVSCVLRNPNAIEAGIALEGAKIINESKEGFNAKCASYVLCNPDAIEAGIALDGAKVINMALSERSAFEITNYIIYNASHSNVLKEAMELVQILNLAEVGKEIKASKEVIVKPSRTEELLLYLYNNEDEEIKVSELKRIKSKSNQ